SRLYRFVVTLPFRLFFIFLFWNYFVVRIALLKDEKGSVIDLAVGIIVGGAFGKIVNSLVNDVIIPPIGWLLSVVDLANIFVLLKRGKKHRITKSRYKSLTHAREDGAVTVNVGVFLNTVLNFVVISVIIFTFVRTINKIKRKKKPKVALCKHCFSYVD